MYVHVQYIHIYMHMYVTALGVLCWFALLASLFLHSYYIYLYMQLGNCGPFHFCQCNFNHNSNYCVVSADQCGVAGTSVNGGQTVINPWVIIGRVASAVCTSSESSCE